MYMKFIFTFLWFLFSAFGYCQNKQNSITFLIHVSGLSDSESVYITGNDPQIGNWNPGYLRLSKLNDSTWIKTLIFEFDKSLEYKITKGTWENEALDEKENIPINSILKVSADTVIEITIHKWKTPQLRAITQTVTGTVNYHLQIEGDGIKPRDVVVWLPPSYHSNTIKKYPVLYMQDGQNLFDATTSAFGYEWRLDEVTDSLIKAEAINEIIIVGIYNSPDRSLEYIYTPLGYAYMDFIVSRLKPFIDSTYRTLSDRNNTAIGGSSAGGLISFLTSWQYPNIFSKAACLSSAFKIRKINYVDTVASYRGPKKDLKFYIDNGAIGLENDLQPGIDDMITALKNIGFELGKDIIHYNDENGVHFESSWAERIWRPLVFFFGKK